MKNTKNAQKKLYYVYILRNDVNDKVYIGQTNDPKDRFYEIQYRGKKIADAIKKIGWDKFHANLLGVYDTEDVANNMEFFYIQKFDSVNNGYNSTYKTNEHRSAKKSAARNAKASATMSKSKWYYNPKTDETIRIIGDAAVPKGFVLGRGGKIKKVKGHDLWLNVTEKHVDNAIAEIA